MKSRTLGTLQICERMRHESIWCTDGPLEQRKKSSSLMMLMASSSVQITMFFVCRPEWSQLGNCACAQGKTHCDEVICRVCDSPGRRSSGGADRIAARSAGSGLQRRAHAAAALHVRDLRILITAGRVQHFRSDDFWNARDCWDDRFHGRCQRNRHVDVHGAWAISYPYNLFAARNDDPVLSAAGRCCCSAECSPHPLRMGDDPAGRDADWSGGRNAPPAARGLGAIRVLGLPFDGLLRRRNCR